MRALEQWIENARNMPGTDETQINRSWRCWKLSLFIMYFFEVALIIILRLPGQTVHETEVRVTETIIRTLGL